MTIASSVVDVRDIDEGKLFFYRVGCVPERYIWQKLHNIGSNGPPISLTSFSSPEKIRSARNLMELISRQINCASWRIYFACRLKEGCYSWEQMSATNPHVVACFETSITYYKNNDVNSSRPFQSTLDNSMCADIPLHQHVSALPDTEADEESSPSLSRERILYFPVIVNGRVCAVIQLLDKMDYDQRLQAFNSQDVNIVKQTCEQVLELIEVCEIQESVDWKLETSILSVEGDDVD